MTLRGTLFLLLIACGLLFGIIVLEPHYRPSAEKKVFLTTPENVTRITIKDGNETHSLQRQSDGWDLSTTPPDRADLTEVKNLLDIAYATEPLNMLAHEELQHQFSLASLGLQNPKRSLTLYSNGDQKETLYFGNEAVGEKNLFAQLQQQRNVFIISSALTDLAFRPIDEFRDHRLTSLTLKELERIQLHQGQGIMNLLHQENGWVMKEPISAVIDPTALTSWIEPLLTASIIARIGSDDGDLAPYGLDQPRATIALFVLEKKEPIMLSLGKVVTNKEPTRDKEQPLSTSSEAFCYIRSSERHSIFKMPTSLEQVFMIAPDLLRDHQFFHLNLDTVDRLQWTIEGRSYLLRREGGDSSDWITEEKNPKKITAAQIEELITALETTRIIAFKTATPSHLQEAGLITKKGALAGAQMTSYATLRFIAHLSENTPDEEAGNHTIAEIHFGTPQGATLFARYNEASELLEIPASTLETVKKICY